MTKVCTSYDIANLVLRVVGSSSWCLEPLPEVVRFTKMQRNNKHTVKDVEMAYQKVCKQDRDDIKVKVNIQSPVPAPFSH